MPRGPDLEALSAALAALPGLGELGRATLEPLPVKGLAHDHIAVGDSSLLLRVPRQSQFGFSAQANLAYQAACFERAAPSDHTPRLHGVIEPQERIPMGALLVDRIFGRVPVLPDDLPALAACMAAIHALPVPPPVARAPLGNHEDPVGGAMAEIERQSRFLAEAELAPETRTALGDELEWARGFARQVAQEGQPVTLVLSDTHPGNFLIEDSGRAVVVDLEKALYGSPGTDLAHATIYSSTTWDPDTWSDLGLVELAAFYRHYLDLLPRDLAERLRLWLMPVRRVTALRALTWCVKWQVLHRRESLADKATAESTEDWSAENSDPALIAHVAGRVAEYLSEPVIARMRNEWLGEPSLADLVG